MGIDMSALTKTDISKHVETTEAMADNGLIDIIVNIVPTNIIQSLGEGYVGDHFLLRFVWFRGCCDWR